MRRMHPASYDRHVRAPRSGLPFRRLFNQALFGRIGGVLFWQRGLLRLAWLFAASALAFRHWEFLRLCAARRVTPGLRNGVVEVGVPPVTIMILVCRRVGAAEALAQSAFFRAISLHGSPFGVWAVVPFR